MECASSLLASEIEASEIDGLRTLRLETDDARGELNGIWAMFCASLMLAAGLCERVADWLISDAFSIVTSSRDSTERYEATQNLLVSRMAVAAGDLKYASFNVARPEA